MSQGAESWYIRRPFVLAVLGTSLSAGRLSGNFWFSRLMQAARGLPEAVGPVYIQNFAKGSQQSPYGVEVAPLIADYNPTHILSEGFAINDAAPALGVITRAEHLDNMAAMRAIWKAKNPSVDITWQTMNGVSADGAALRPDLALYYADEIDFADTNGDRILDHYNGLPSPPAGEGGWPKPLPLFLTTDGDGLHPLWEGSLEVYFWPGLIYWLRCRMAEYWGLPIPNPPDPPPLPEATYAVVAGGGPGGGPTGGGGGGAGGLREGVNFLENLFGPVLVGGAGEPSALGDIVADPGGAGGGYGTPPPAPTAGASGGGGGMNSGSGPAPGAEGVSGQGNPGGDGSGISNQGAGGGGGAGGAGEVGTLNGGQGGAGRVIPLPGGSVTVAAGGPGGSFSGVRPAYLPGAGPSAPGGGGRGAADNRTLDGDEPGGPGRVWVWYPGPPRATGGTVTEFGGFTVHEFTADGTLAPL